MIEFFFSILAAVIVIPLIVYIPLGLTKRGKWYVVVGTLIIGLIGTGLTALLVQWQAILLIILFSVIVGLITERKSGIYNGPEAINILNNQEMITENSAPVEPTPKLVNSFTAFDDMKDEDPISELYGMHSSELKSENEESDLLSRQQEDAKGESSDSKQGYLSDIEKMLDFQQKSNDSEDELWEYIEAK
ncbi:hypothetical protein J7E38_22060 [Bacillus sp. ISL-35]|uniref:hypothetical protein n=1 Tax=Bacillus sp. ISL-35 TaxID=2819122 RepID=UPI001BEC8910|nr:hypothetical protein [Bacillus sp. ISL-35]MBT2681649.1 hypothetical protein [Bacillus sp. ISL-35]MBT2702315.1 hypothetical protein [Chryseobacterium sp. ISL-80]